MHGRGFGLMGVVVAGMLLIAAPSRAEETQNPGGKRAEFCQQNPGKCEAARERRQAFCAENPETCAKRKERRAERQEFCQKNPEKCAEQRERMQQRRAEFRAKCEADPAKCEQMKKERRARIERRQAAGKTPSGAGPQPPE